MGEARWSGEGNGTTRGSWWGRASRRVQGECTMGTEEMYKRRKEWPRKVCRRRMSYDQLSRYVRQAKRHNKVASTTRGVV